MYLMIYPASTPPPLNPGFLSVRVPFSVAAPTSMSTSRAPSRPASPWRFSKDLTAATIDSSALPAEPEALLQRYEVLDQFRLTGHAILFGGEAGALRVEPVEGRGGPRPVAHLSE